MSDLGHEQTDKELKRIENLISKEYSQAAQELEDKMKKHFADFDRKDAEMKRKLDAGVITEKQYKDWRVAQIAVGDRWREVRDSMVDTLVNTDKAAVSIIQGNSIKAYGDNMNYGTYEIEHSSKINTGFSLYDMDTVKNLLKEDPGIVPMPKDLNIPKDELWNRQKLSSAVLQGILQGDSISGIADRLSQVATMDESAAIRNARTYTTAAENKGRLDSYERAEKLGIKTNKMWIATLDDRTRAEHRHLDKMSVPPNEDFKVDGYTISFPGDPSAEPEMFYNCRCTLVSDIVGYPYNDERNEDKLGDMTYEEWKHAKDKEKKEEPTKFTGIKPSDWENWAMDPEPYQQALNGEPISDYLAGDKLSEADKEHIKDVAEEIQRRAESEVVPYDTLYRGESYDSLQEAQSKYYTGKIVTNDKLTSYATSADIANEYADSDGKIKVIITNTNERNDINGSVGVMTDPLGVGGSSEVITPEGMKSKVFSTYYDKEENTLYVGMVNNTEPKDYEAKEEKSDIEEAEEKLIEINKEEPIIENEKDIENIPAEESKNVEYSDVEVNELYSDRPTVDNQIKGVSKKGGARSEWLQETLDIDEDEAEIMLDAVEAYTKGDYTIVHNNSPKAQETIDVLDEMLHDPNMPVFNGTIYRGVHVLDSDDLTALEKVEAIVKDGTWNEPGITSFSSKRDKAQQFATGGAYGDETEGVCVLLVNKKNISGCPIQHLTDQRPEGEVLVPSDIKDRGYKIVNYKIQDKVRNVEQFDIINGHIEHTGIKTFKSKWAIIEVEENDF